jgi:hypothetical protein
MTACPCAQGLVEAGARERLAQDGFTEDEIERIVDHVPVATHNQRGLGTLRIGCTEACDDEIDALMLLAIVEDSMSSEIYELMKRSDEAAVVEKAHRRPRFVEDCVREMIGGVVEPTRPSSRRARRTWRRSTSTTSWPSATACWARCAPSWPAATPSPATPRCAAGSTPGSRARPGPGAACAGRR